MQKEEGFKFIRKPKGCNIAFSEQIFETDGGRFEYQSLLYYPFLSDKGIDEKYFREIFKEKKWETGANGFIAKKNLTIPELMECIYFVQAYKAIFDLYTHGDALALTGLSADEFWKKVNTMITDIIVKKDVVGKSALYTWLTTLGFRRERYEAWV